MSVQYGTRPHRARRHQPPMRELRVVLEERFLTSVVARRLPVAEVRADLETGLNPDVRRILTPCAAEKAMVS
jgi:hypothetical protein